MAFHRRKLLNPSVIDPNLTKYCSPFCDAEENPAGICPFDCLSLCYPVCYTAFPHTLPSPPPFPPPPTTVLYPIAPHKPQKLSLLLTVSLAVLATVFFIFTCYILYKFYSCWYTSRRRRRLERLGSDQDPGSAEFLDSDIQGPVVDHHVWYIRTIGLQPSVISKISVVKYKKGDGLVEGTDCSVCLNEFQEDESLRLLPKCNHAFHIPCIDTWLRSHTNCPMCRAGIVTNTIQALEEDTVVHNSGQVEETRIENPGIIDQASEIRIGIEEQEDNESRAQAQSGYKIDDGEIQQMRRSVSLDSLSATAIYSTVADAFPGRNSDNQLVETKSPLNEESCKIGSSSVKRSHSCSAKVFLSRYNSRSRDSVIPR